MVHQFEAEKCLHAVLTGNLVLWHYVIGSTPGEPPGNSDGTNPRTRAESWGKSPGVARGGGDVGAWNWLMHKAALLDFTPIPAKLLSEETSLQLAETMNTIGEHKCKQKDVNN